MVLLMAFRPRIFQNGSLLRLISTVARLIGIDHLPTRRYRAGGRTRADESSGAYVRKLRFKKSKMLCLAGFTPVAKVDHATGDSGGKVVRSLL